MLETPVNIDDREAVGPPPLQFCPYRRAVAATGLPGFFVCDCAGGVPIGLDEVGDPRLAETCGFCNIPSGIDPGRNRRSCLFLIPVRIWEDGHLRTGFSCRWFFRLKPKKLSREAWQCCLGCPHWFPRPPDEAGIPRMIDWIQRIIRLYWEPEPLEGIWNTPPSRRDTGDSPGSLLSDRLLMRINRFREVMRMRQDRRASQLTGAEE